MYISIIDYKMGNIKSVENSFKKAGVKVDGDTLAWEDVWDTAPGSNFLERPHTLTHCREALRPDLFARDPRAIWVADGGKDMYIRALEKYKELKKGIRPQQLPEDVRKEMDQILKQAEKRLVK